MNSRMLARWLVVSVVLMPAWRPVRGEDATEESTNGAFKVDLKDGSSLICRPRLEAFPLKTSFAELQIPLARIESVKIDPEKKGADLSLLNGDRLQGEYLIESFAADSLLGKLEFSLETVDAITTTLVAEPRYEDSPARRNACINNLRQIDAAKEQWALATGQSNGAVVDISGVNEYIKGSTTPTCPAGGAYTYHVIGQDPACSVPGHCLR